MLSLTKPTERTIRSLLAQRKDANFSYPFVGATRTAPPAAWRINHMRLLVGRRKKEFDKVAQALFSWELLAIEGLQVFSSTNKLQPGTDVAILSRHFGIWSVDFCRVIYVLRDQPEKDGAILRSGFGYGTLLGHAVHGEEIFSIEWHPATKEVWYDIYSFSRPANLLIHLLSPLARATQRRFARASLEKAAQLTADAD